MTLMLYQVVKVVNRQTKQGKGFGSLICSMNVLTMLVVFVDGFVKLHNYQFLIVRTIYLISGLSYNGYSSVIEKH